MSDRAHIFHLSIPCRDLDEALRFYEGELGCRAARRRADRLTLDFFGDQVVCHLAPESIEDEPRMYPRHFGVTFRERADFDALLTRAVQRRLDFFREPFVRFPGERAEHRAFFLRDPSNNLIEFKHYADPGMMH